MFWHVEIKDKPGIFDSVGEGVKKDILDLGIHGISAAHFSQIYTLEGKLSEVEIERICRELLADKVSQDYCILSSADKSQALGGEYVAEVAYNPGVMDPVEESTLKGIRDLGINTVTSVKTAKKYILKGKLSPTQFKTISGKLLYNKLIQHIVDPGAGECPSVKQPGYSFKRITVDLLGAPDKKLQELSRAGQLFLNLKEMRQIKDCFTKRGSNPTDCELETIAQTWSEHCIRHLGGR